VSLAHGICNEITSRNKRGEENHIICKYVYNDKKIFFIIKVNLLIFCIKIYFINIINAI
jgi:hypothetical protein